jgi:hypothetical protein
MFARFVLSSHPYECTVVKVLTTKGRGNLRSPYPCSPSPVVYLNGFGATGRTRSSTQDSMLRNAPGRNPLASLEVVPYILTRRWMAA